MSNAFQSGFSMGANIYNNAQEMKLREKADQRAQELHDLQSDELRDKASQRGALKEAGKAYYDDTAQYDVGGQKFDNLDDANQFYREARRGIPAQGEVGAAPQAPQPPAVGIPKESGTNSRTYRADKAAAILAKAGLRDEAQKYLDLAREDTIREQTMKAVAAWKEADAKGDYTDFVQKYGGDISADKNNPMQIATGTGPDGKPVITIVNTKTGRAQFLPPEKALYHTLELIHLGAGDAKTGAEMIFKNMELATKETTANAHKVTADAAMKKADIDEKESPARIGLYKAQANSANASASYASAHAALTDTQRQIQELGLTGIKENTKLIEELNRLTPEEQLGTKGKSLLLRAASNAATKAGDYAALERILMGTAAGKNGATRFDYKKNDDGTYLITDKQSNTPVGHTTATALMLPIGMTEADFNKEKKIAAKQNIIFGTGIDEATGKIVTAYQSADGRTYSTLAEAMNPPKAKASTGGVQANTTPSANTPPATPKPSPLSAAEQLDLRSDTTSKRSPGVPFVG